MNLIIDQVSSLIEKSISRCNQKKELIRKLMVSFKSILDQKRENLDENEKKSSEERLQKLSDRLQWLAKAIFKVNNLQ